ncbi:MAG: gliding motility protein GldN [Saprospiraceae bacterium]|nr:gliding motility protein GldN [Saprospiraceae bacterium]
MKVFRISFLVLLFGLNYSFSFAQVDEEVTESSELDVPSEYLDDIVTRQLVPEQRVLAYEPIREADIVWTKRVWRILDTREKMNIAFMEPNRYFFQVLLDLARNGDVKIFAKDDFKRVVLNDELEKMLYKIDTQSVWDPETYIEEIKVIRNDINPEDIQKYRIKELWYFDKEASRLQCRILGIAPIKDERDLTTGEVKYSGPMFWVYYPEVRKYLTKERVFNDKNDSSPMTWADIFDGRFFSSYIFKESNVLDYRLEDFFSGEDENAGVKMLLESERIKNELLNFEHDLWVY